MNPQGEIYEKYGKPVRVPGTVRGDHKYIYPEFKNN